MRKLFLFLVMALLTSSLFAQGNATVGGLTKARADNLYVRLDGGNWTTNPFQLPLLTTDPTVTGEGKLYWNTTTHKFMKYDGSQWAVVGSGDFLADGSVPMTRDLDMGTGANRGGIFGSNAIYLPGGTDGIYTQINEWDIYNNGGTLTFANQTYIVQQESPPGFFDRLAIKADGTMTTFGPINMDANSLLGSSIVAQHLGGETYNNRYTSTLGSQGLTFTFQRDADLAPILYTLEMGYSYIDIYNNANSDECFLYSRGLTLYSEIGSTDVTADYISTPKLQDITDTGVVANLNADMVDGSHATDFTKAPVTVPVQPTDAGVAGTWAYDANYLYICVATNTWKRVAIGTWTGPFQ